MVKKTDLSPHYRPPLPANDEKADIDALKLMVECWQEEAAHRPSFNDIKKKLRAMNKGKYV